MMQLEESIKESIRIKEDILQDVSLLKAIEQIVRVIALGYRKRNKVLLCGNGGSASDAQHIAAELSGKMYMDRAPLNAEALHVNTSYLTAVANDISYDQVFSRAVHAKGKPNDILICISTSGNSENVIQAALAGRERQMIIIGLTGQDGGALSSHCDYILKIPSQNVARIQENHILLGHLICENVEKHLFKN